MVHIGGDAMPAKVPKKVSAAFFRTAAGSEPVRDWLKHDLDAADRRVVGGDIATVEYGWPVGMPVCRPLGKGLFEVRSSLSANRIGRVIFCFQDDEMVLLHGFLKKSQKTPKADIEIARDRQKEIGA
jgi:phage-related protein